MKEIRWGVVFITLFFLLFLGVVAYGYFLFQGQTEQIQMLKERLKNLDKAQNHTYKVLTSAKSEIKYLQLNLGSLRDNFKEGLNTLDKRLTNFNERLLAQEKDTKEITSKMRELTSRVWSLEDRFKSLSSKAKVDLGNISVEKK